MNLVLEFMKFVEEQPDQSVAVLLDKVLLKCREILGAEAGTIFLIEERGDGSLHVRPMSLQNDAVDMSRVVVDLTVDKQSLAGYVASSGEAVFVDDSYQPSASWPFRFNHDIDRASGYRTVSVLAFPIRTYSESVIGVVQLINRHVPSVHHPVPFEPSQVELIRPVNQFIGRAIQRTVLLDEIREANVQLKSQNERLTAEIENRKQAETMLETALSAADAANRAKTEFLANMSHELRTPLNSIIGFSEMILDEKFGAVGSPKYLDYSRNIITAGRHLLGVINDILDLAKAEVGKAELHEDPVDLREAVATAVSIVSGRAEIAGVSVVTQLADGLPRLLADQRMVKQILINLLSNAVKFTPRGNDVTVRAEINGEGECCLTVADHGRGIAAKDIPTALAPFGQVDNVYVRPHEGTGLGLPLVRAMAELHGGRLELRSEPNVGTVATVRFPADRVMVAA